MYLKVRTRKQGKGTLDSSSWNISRPCVPSVTAQAVNKNRLKTQVNEGVYTGKLDRENSLGCDEICTLNWTEDRGMRGMKMRSLCPWIRHS